jgi:hypothetical protein
MSSPYSGRPVMVALPVDGDELLVITGNGTDTQRLPWELLQTGFITRQASVPTVPTSSLGAPYALASDAEYLFFRNGTQWGRIPYTADNWEDTYNRLLRPVAPSLGAEPVGAPEGHFFYDTADEAVKFKQGGTYVSLQPPQSFKTVTDGTNSATADQTGQLRFRSSDSSIVTTVTGNDVTYGDVLNLQINAIAIPVGDFADDGTYAAFAHNHDADYAPLIHDHDGVYATAGHNHDGTYSAVGHLHTGVYAPVSHTQAASTIDSGTFDDTRIAATNVTQHVAAINHDALLNFSANKHIDHTAVSILTEANSGLSGGGTIAANRSLALDFMNVPSLATPDLALDSILIYDQSVGAVRRVLLSTLGFDVANHFHTAAQITSGTLASNRGGLNANASGFTGMLKMSAGVASVAVAGTDYSAPGHTHLAVNISDFSTAVLETIDGMVHTQNTDTGTTSAFFGLATGSSGGRIYWDSSEFRLRNAGNTDYASLRVKELYVEGAVTTIVSNQVEIGDSVLLLNQDITTAGTNSDAGFDVKLLAADDTTRRDVGFRYNVTARRWTGSGFKATTEAPVTKTFAQKHEELIGDGVETTFVVTHDLNTSAVVVSIIEVATGEVVLVDWEITSADSITITFGATTPGADAFRVVVIG